MAAAGIIVPLALGTLAVALSRRSGATGIALDAAPQGVPFAPGLAKGRWPVLSIDPHHVPRTTTAGVLDNDRAGVSANRYFGATREGGRRHAGIDLEILPNQPVIAIAPGIVRGFPTGYVGLGAVLVDHGPLAVLYGEMTVNPTLSVGQKIAAGTVLGKGAASSQGTELHLETWRPNQSPSSFTPWFAAGAPPAGLLDPTQLLLRLR